MKAVYCSKYGPSSNLRLKEVPIPEVKEDEVLLKVKATTINDYDWSMVRGKPIPYRLLFGLFRPKRPIPGMEVSGEVVKVGNGVTKFSVGDCVFGDTSDHGFGTFAEYVALNESCLTIKPDYIDFSEASSLPHAALLALQGFEMGGLKAGSKILLNGAGGGVGSIAFHLAKDKNCHISGVDTGEKLKKLTSMGFDEVMDYKKTDFTKTGTKYDFILDCKSTKGPTRYLKALKPGGVYITVGGNILSLLLILFLSKPLTLFNNKKIGILGLKPNKGIDQILKLYKDGKIKPVIDGPYPLDQAPQQIQRFGEGLHSGKIVLTVNG